MVQYGVGPSLPLEGDLLRAVLCMFDLYMNGAAWSRVVISGQHMLSDDLMVECVDSMRGGGFTSMCSGRWGRGDFTEEGWVVSHILLFTLTPIPPLLFHVRIALYHVV